MKNVVSLFLLTLTLACVHVQRASEKPIVLLGAHDDLEDAVRLNARRYMRADGTLPRFITYRGCVYERTLVNWNTDADDRLWLEVEGQDCKRGGGAR